MANAAELIALLERMREDMVRWDSILNGSDTTTVNLRSGSVASVRKFMKDLGASVANTIGVEFRKDRSIFTRQTSMTNYTPPEGTRGIAYLGQNISLWGFRTASNPPAAGYTGSDYEQDPTGQWWFTYFSNTKIDEITKSISDLRKLVVDGLVYGVSGKDTLSGALVPPETNIAQTIHNASGTIRFWRKIQPPSDGAETDSLVKDGYNQWWVRVSDIMSLTQNERTKLAGIANEATKNATDAQLRDRGTHTGTQPIDSVSGLPASLSGLSQSSIDRDNLEIQNRVKGDNDVLFEVRDGRMFAVGGGKTPSGLAIPKAYKTALLTITNNAGDTSSTWRPIAAPTDGLETDVLKKDANGDWWRIMVDEGSKQADEKRKKQMALTLLRLRVVANATGTPANTTTVELDQELTDLTVGGTAIFLYTPTVTNEEADPKILRDGVSRSLRAGDNTILQKGEVVAGVPLIIQQYSSTTMRVVGSVSKQGQIAKMMLPLEVITATANSATVQLPAEFIHLNTVTNDGSLFFYTPTMTNTADEPVLIRNGATRTIRGPNNEKVLAGQIIAGIPLLLQQVSNVTFRLIGLCKTVLDLKADKSELASLAAEMRDGREHVVWGAASPQAVAIPPNYSAETVSCVYNNLSSRWRRDTAPVGNVQTVDHVQDSGGSWWRRLINMNPDGRIYSVAGETPSGMVIPTGTDRIYCEGASAVGVWRLSADQTSGTATDRVQISGGQFWVRLYSLPYAARISTLENALYALQLQAIRSTIQRGILLPDRPLFEGMVVWRTHDDPREKMAKQDLWAPIDPPPIFSFEDNFDRANQKLDEDDRWTQVKGNASAYLQIVNDAVRISTGAVEVVDQASEELTIDHFIEALISGSGAANDQNTGVYLCGRMPKGKNAGYRLELRNSQWIIRSVTDSTTMTALAQGTFSAVTPYTARLECVGSTIRAIVNGNVVGSVIDSKFASGTVGIGIRALNTSVLSNYQIDSMKAGAIG